MRDMAPLPDFLDLAVAPTKRRPRRIELKPR
jgi:hypothetical protein